MEYTEKEDIGHKILVIGPSKAGKTCFIRRYVDGYYSANDAYKETIGVDFALKYLDLADGTTVALKLWDIAGHERTQQMVRMYYKGAHACIIMFDLTRENSLDICLQWKQDLDNKCTLTSGDPIPCILLANKSDLTTKRKFSTEEISRFSKEHKFIHFMETSVKDNKNIDESMRYLVENLLKHDDLPQHQNSSDLILSAEDTKPNPKKSSCC